MTPEIVIRAATSADVPGIAAVHVASRRTTYASLLSKSYIEARNYQQRPDFWQQSLGDDSFTQHYIALGEDQVIGFAAAGPARDAAWPGAGELYALYLLATHQGRGIGRCLFETMHAILRGGGYPTLQLQVLADNPA